MILSNKYRIDEQSEQLVLIEMYQSPEKVDGSLTGVMIDKERTIGHWSRANVGRNQLYQRMLNLEISGSEKQDLTTILEIVNGFQQQIEDFFGGE
jgi:hypothetical protein